MAPRESARSRGNYSLLNPAGPVIKCFVIPPNSKLEKKKKTAKKSFPLRRLAHKFYRGFTELARPDRMRVESSSCCFSRELVLASLRRYYGDAEDNVD